MNNLTKSQVVVYVVGIICLAAIILGAGGCTRSLVLDSRDRKQHRLEECISQGYGGVVELGNGEGWSCTGGKTTN